MLQENNRLVTALGFDHSVPILQKFLKTIKIVTTKWILDAN